MDFIRFSIERPVAVIAAVLMAVLFGALALTRIPIQLIPDVRKPVIEIETRVNGELRQRGDTSQMVFSPARLIAHISAVMTLEPGDVILRIGDTPVRTPHDLLDRWHVDRDRPEREHSETRGETEEPEEEHIDVRIGTDPELVRDREGRLGQLIEKWAVAPGCRWATG